MASEGRDDGAPRGPRSLLVHWMVDTGIAFCAVAMVALIGGISLRAVIVISASIGALVVPFTRRIERRDLEAREEDGPGHA